MLTFHFYLAQIGKTQQWFNQNLLHFMKAFIFALPNTWGSIIESMVHSTSAQGVASDLW